jgi:bacteriorhodopsin
VVYYRSITTCFAIATVAIPFTALAADLESVFNIAEGAAILFSRFFGVLAIAMFVYGIVKYIAASGNAEKEKQARGYIIYGLIGLFILVAFWALVTVIVTTFGLEGENPSITPPPPPTV